MDSRRMMLQLVAIGLLCAGSAFAQGSSAGGSAGAQASGSAEVKAATPEAQAAANVAADAQARAEFERQKKAIAEKGAKVSAKTRAKAEAQLTTAASEVNGTAEKQGEAKVATRLASEFGGTGEAMIAERQNLDASWGDLMIAHTLSANSKTDITTSQLIEMKKDGTGWGQIAAGLGLELGSVVSGVNTEGRVASGLARADGKVALMRGEGARAGIGSALGIKAGAGQGKGANVGAGLGVGAGVKINH